ncbi:acyltransferase domain-containing protein [Streptomyces sp. NPDC005423]|uniref:type I polyketide synthase n=1 Tax=Streptomyces sp. NPDC005423 TaxID=3155343 RepID=UPI0033BCF9CA
MEHSEELDNAVAIVGMGCRFPRAGGVEEFWEGLIARTDAVGPVPPDRFDITDHYAPEPGTAGKTVSRHGGFLDDVFGFDAAFFGISPVEARGMDPQQRILLQVVWEALEGAGVRPSSLAGTRGGVFVGQATTDYAEVGPGPLERGVREMVGSRLRAATAGRVSYALDLRGPSVVLDTACSSSLVAVHAARQSLLTGESDLAIAGAVSVILSPADSIAYSQGGMLSARGRCRFGDAHADGFVRSEGVAAVVLKRLPDALRDGDDVVALLLGSAVTNDGKASGLLLHPSVDGQAQMLREACRSANVDPAHLDYVEAHGTGTPVGDAVELQALAQATGPGRDAGTPLRTGSVKTNIGHTEAAAGLAGLIKAALIARHGVIPASLHLEEPHPLLAEKRIPVEVVRANTPLKKAGPRALVGVSSFGLTGTNAHVVLAEHLPAPERPARPEPGLPGPRLLVLSARSRASLLRRAASFASWLEPAGAGRDIPLDDACATAALRRDAHPHRLWAVGSTHDELAAVLRTLAEGGSHPDGGTCDAGTATPRRTVFVLPGQGSQWLGMGRGLLASSPAFKEALEICDRAVRREAGWSVLDLLTRDADALPTEVDVVQPALWAIQVALAAAWQEKGVRPDAVIGHSMGEVAAARISDAMSPADAAAVICRRSRLMRRREGHGAMLVVELGPDATRQAIAPYADQICVAAENSPTTTVVAGDRTALTALEERLRAQNVLCRRVKVDVASHSPDMEPLRADLGDLLSGLTPADTSCAMVSTVTGRPLAGPELTASYWMDNLRRPVRFADTVRTVAEREPSVFVEISPHPVLSAAVEETLLTHGLEGSVVASVRRGQDEHTELIRSAGRFFAAGGRIDFTRWYGTRTPPVALPPYSWDTSQYRTDTAPLPAAVPATRVLGASLGQLGAADWAGGVRVAGFAAVPPVVPLALMLEAGRQAVPGSALALENVRLGDEPVDAESAVDSDLQVTVARPRADGTRPVRAEMTGPGPADRVLFASGHLAQVQDDPAARSAGSIDAALARCRRYLPAADFEDLARRRGIEIGEPFRAVEQLWREDGRAVARLRLPKAPLPAAWEAGLLPLIAAWPAGDHSAPYVPTGFDRVRLLDEPSDEFWSVCSFQAHNNRTARAHVLLLAPDGRELARFTGIRLRRLSGPPAQTDPATSALTSRLTGLGWMLSSAVRGLPGAIRTPQRQPLRPRASRTVIPTPREVTAGMAASRSPRAGEELSTRAAALLGMAVGDLDRRRSLRDLGLDSLMAAQLRQQLRTECGWDITAGRLLGDESIEKIELLMQREQYT